MTKTTTKQKKSPYGRVFGFIGAFEIDILIPLPPTILVTGRRVRVATVLFTLVLSVFASVVAHYICVWLDGKKR